jgi:hypothetical protein
MIGNSSKEFGRRVTVPGDRNGGDWVTRLYGMLELNIQI